MTTTFDKLAYVDSLKSSGISPEQARAHANALEDAMKDSVVTKHDLQRELEPIRQDLAVLKWMIGFIMVAVALPYIKNFL